MTNTDIDSAGTFLFVPGDRPERFDKAVAAADHAILDLEDAVAAPAKAAALAQVVSYLQSGQQAIVRVNGTGTSWRDAELEALRAVPGLVAVMLPKAGSAVEVEAVATLTRVPVIALVETATGLLGAPQIARARGVVRLALGSLDLAADLGANTPALISRARLDLALASRAAGLPGPIDGITTEIADAARIEQDTRAASEYGFTGKLCIHPAQVAPTRAGLRPSEQEIAWAGRVLAAIGDQAVAQIDGEMVDAPVIARAQAIRRRAGA